MRKRRVILGTVLPIVQQYSVTLIKSAHSYMHIDMSRMRFLLVFGVPLSQSAQEASSFANDPEQDMTDRALIVGFVRTISTAEVADFTQYGSYSSWQTLLAHNSVYLNEWLVEFYSPNPSVHFGTMPEILPGWSLRLEVNSDGRGYDMRLQDLNDKRCGYAAITDESGVIRQCKWIDCQIE